MNNNINYSELFPNNYNICTKGRPTIGDINVCAVTLIAVKNTLISEQMNCTLPNSRLAWKTTLNEAQILLYAFYDPTISSSYQYMIEDFQFFFRNIPKNKPIVFCGDLNFPGANWKAL